MIACITGPQSCIGYWMSVIVASSNLLDGSVATDLSRDGDRELPAEHLGPDMPIVNTDDPIGVR